MASRRAQDGNDGSPIELLLSTIYNMKVQIYNIFNKFMCKYMMIINSNYTCLLLAVVYKNDVRTNEEIFVRALCLQ